MAPYDSLNLGDHVGDDPLAVQDNRRQLMQVARLPSEPVWLKQVHGVKVVELDGTVASGVEADAVFSRRIGQVCAIMTADCLPVLFASRAGDCVAAAHAGWRGLAAGVLPATLAAMAVDPGATLAWMGPAIGPKMFEVGDEVRDAFVAQSELNVTCFVAQGDRWLADIYGLAQRQLQALGIDAIYGGEFCTVSDAARFFSYRRDGICGRMASLIWMA